MLNISSPSFKSPNLRSPFLLHIKHCQKSHTFMVSQNYFVFEVSVTNSLCIFPSFTLNCILDLTNDSEVAEASCGSLVCQATFCIHCYYSQEPCNDSSISYICIEIRGQIEKVDVSLFSGRSTWELIMYVFILKWVLNFFFFIF